MATPRPPYVMIPLGTVENAIAAGASPASALLLLRIWTHRDQRSIPGLLRSGPAGLSETLNVPVAQVQGQLAELERVGCILFDCAACLILCVGAIDCERTE